MLNLPKEFQHSIKEHEYNSCIERYLFSFDESNYDLSLARGFGTYGGQWEAALRDKTGRGDLVYPEGTMFEYDVLPYLSDEAAIRLIDMVKSNNIDKNQIDVVYKED